MQSLPFILLMLCFAFYPKEALSGTLHSEYMDWNYRIHTADTNRGPFAKLPQYKDSNIYAQRHFALLSGPLVAVTIEFDPPEKAGLPTQIPLLFRLQITYPDGFSTELRFISHLDLIDGRYRNSFLVLAKHLKYRITPLSFRDDPEVQSALRDEHREVDATSVELGFTADRNLFDLIKEFTVCSSGYREGFFSTYRFSESKLARKFISSCRDKIAFFTVDQIDWLEYGSLIYQLQRNRVPFYITLKNDLRTIAFGRNPNHVKIYSPAKDVAMLTTATITLDALQSDDWFLIVRGKSAVKILKQVFLNDLLFGRYQRKPLSDRVEVFSSATRWERNLLPPDDPSRTGRRDYDEMILEDLRAAKKFITFYGPALLNIGGHYFDYRTLASLLIEMMQKGVYVNIINICHTSAETFISEMMKYPQFRNILPYNSFDGRKKETPVHARLLNIDSRVCYLFTGTMANVSTNELAFRIREQSMCQQIAKHLAATYGRTNFQNLFDLAWSGILKLFRVQNIHSSPRSYNFVINDKDSEVLDLNQLQPQGSGR